MNLVKNSMYKVKNTHPNHPGRIGRFEFLGGPRAEFILLSDYIDPLRLFAVGLYDIVDFDPKVDNVVE
jgi:hypothetical protein